MKLETIDLLSHYQRLVVAIKLDPAMTATKVTNKAGVSVDSLVYARYSKSHNVEIYNRLAIAFNELKMENNND